MEYAVPKEYFFRVHHVRPRFKNDIENVLFYIAKKLDSIGELPSDEFAVKVNEAISKYPGNAKREMKTINNWRTEISALFGFVEHTYTTDKPGLRAIELSRNQDLAHSFKVWAYCFQYPGAHITSKSILDQIEAGIHFKPAQYILRVLSYASRKSGNASISKYEVCHCIFNDLRVTRDNEGEAKTWNRIVANRNLNYTYDQTGDVVRYATDILDYMVLANLLQTTNGKDYTLNPLENECISMFCNSTDWFSGYDKMIADRYGTLSAINSCYYSWFTYVNRPVVFPFESEVAKERNNTLLSGLSSVGLSSTTSDEGSWTTKLDTNRKYPSKPANLSMDKLYSLREISKLVIELYPTEQNILGTIRSWGFLIRDPFVYDTNTTPLEYLKTVFLSQDIFSSAPYLLRFDNNQLVKSILSDLEKDYTIMEFEENQYINIRKLEKIGIRKEDILSCCDQIRKEFGQEPFFTAKQVRDAEITPLIDSLGFDYAFYDSIIRNCCSLVRTTIGKTSVYSFIWEKITVSNIIVEFLSNVRVIAIDQLVDTFINKYGIELTRSAILSKIKETDLYYDNILDYLYINFEAYHDDL